MQEFTQAVAKAAEVVTSHGFTIVGAAFCLSICIGLIREAITGKAQP
jgi:hypothetical protein